MSAAHDHPLSAQPIAPFPGLRPFEPDEDYLFFGRERQTDELLRKLRTTRFLSILGTSGSGKSSLVRSGLIPTLYGGGMTSAGSRWRVAIMRPGENPLGNLAAALSAPEALGDENAAFFETTLRASNLGLGECIRQARIPAGDNVLVLVDQFEELFRYKHSRRAAGHDEAVAFVKLLLGARNSETHCFIAITMRSDFIGDCMEFASLPEAVNDGVYLVPRMTREELREAITGPVSVGGATIAPRLVSRLLNDVGDDPDQLPILQHALMRTWNFWEDDHQPGEPLDLRHYEAIGTMRSALSRHAEEAFSELDERGRQIAEKLFKALTDKGADVRGVRRPAPVREICALTGATFRDVANVVEIFRKPGRSFLMPPPGVALHEGSILDISHESLMRVWERLTAWADEEARSAQQYLAVARDAARHEEGTVALLRDPELQFALNWRKAERPTEEWARRYDPSFPRAMAFLEASEKERNREVRERERRRRNVILILSLASLLLAALGVYAFVQKLTADRQTAQAQKALQSADAANAAALRDSKRAMTESERAKTEQERAETERERAEQQTDVAQEQTELAVSQRTIAESERSKAEANAREAREQGEVARKAEGLALTEKDKAVKQQTRAETQEKETLRLSYLAAARALALKITNERPPISPALALEVDRLYRENGGRAEDPDVFTAMLSALRTVEPPPVRRGFSDSVRALALTSDPQTVLAGGDDGSIWTVDLRNDAKPALIANVASPVRSLAVRGDLFAAGTAGGRLVIGDLRGRNAAQREIAAGTASLSAVAFQPRGTLIAAGGSDGSVRAWNADDAAAPPITFRTPDGKRVTAVVFSPDGKRLAAGLMEGRALLWDVAASAAKPTPLCGSEPARSLAFRPDGQVVACGGRDGLIHQHYLVYDEDAVTSLTGHASTVNALAYASNGNFLASASSDRSVRIWHTKTAGVPPIVLSGHESWVWAVAFTPDGQRLVSGGEDRTVRIWPARTKVLAADLCRNVMSGKAPPMGVGAWEFHMGNIPQGADPCPVRN
jgi:hypothetical protein